MTSAGCVVRKVLFKSPITFLCMLHWIPTLWTFDNCENLKSAIIIVCYLSLMFATSCVLYKCLMTLKMLGCLVFRSSGM